MTESGVVVVVVVDHQMLRFDKNKVNTCQEAKDTKI